MTRIPFSEMADRMASQAWSKRMWLKDHGSKRPEFEVMQRQRELEALEQSVTDYKAAAQRKENTNV